MAVKKKSDRKDPKKNKSLAIRTVVANMPDAKAKEVAEAVKKEFGHTVKLNMIYMVKTKSNMKKSHLKTKTSSHDGRPVGALKWVEAIKIARHLLQVTGSVDNAVALLKAIDG